MPRFTDVKDMTEAQKFTI